MPRVGQMVIDFGFLTRFELIWYDFWWWWNGSEMIYNWCERGYERWQTLLRYDQVGQKIRVSGMRKWNELVWKCDETIDANNFLASTFCPSLILYDLEHCVND